MNAETQIKLTGCSGMEIKYEYRYNRVLLIFTNFVDDKLKGFAEMLELATSQIDQVEKILKYDDVAGAILVTMKVGYDEKESNDEIHEVFNCYFNKAIAV